MEIQRAEEIFKSYGTFEVIHNGSPVWIEAIDRDNQTAKVKQMTNSDNKEIVVPVNELFEVDNKPLQ